MALRRKRRGSALWTVLAASSSALAPAGAPLAALGEAPAQAAPGAAVSATVATAGAAAYARRETTLPSGTVVREFISNTGVVFGVAWEGPILPDLREILGKHFDTMVAESAKRPRAGRSRLQIERPDVVIVSAGRMRAFEGSAWIPSKLPPGFDAADVR